MFYSNSALLFVELAVYLTALLIYFAIGKKLAAVALRIDGVWTAVANRRMLSICLVTATVLIIRGAMIAALPTPIPGIHDEFSYLLAGDTFASGRLTNPSHPLWRSFETFYVIQQPTYASMYPPAQGLAIAFGQVLTHQPWMGVYFSVAIMCGAICWMLQGWVPPKWALLGAAIVAFRLGIFSYWSESYWGGAVAAIGGALTIGAFPRLTQRPAISSALLLGFGVLILANSRPFEGVLVTVPVCGAILIQILKKKSPQLYIWGRQVVLPFFLVTAIGGACMLFYFWRVTGSPFRMPYMVHSAVYEITGPFLWQPLRKTPAYRYEVMRKYHVERQTAAYIRAHSLPGWVSETAHKAESLLIFYFWPAVLPTLAALPFLLRNRNVQAALLLIAIMFAGLSFEIWPMTQHYHAPIAAAMSLLLVEVIRFWRRVQWRGEGVGLAIATTIPVFCAIMLGLRLLAAGMHYEVPGQGLVPWFTIAPGNQYRARVSDYLERQPGEQLALVRYAGNHHVDEEWVHNAANIDGSKVVWARFSDDEQNERLLRYFHGRRVWLVDVAEKEGRLKPLEDSGDPRTPLSQLSTVSHF